MKPIPTTTLEKLAIHGFTLPSVIVAKARFARPLDMARVRRAFAVAALAWPRLSSRVRVRFGTPIAFVHIGESIPVHEASTLDVKAWLRVPNLQSEAPFEVHVAGHEIGLRAHHAVLDGAGAMALVRLVGSSYADMPVPPHRPAVRSPSLWGWARTANVRRRFPADAFGADRAIDGSFSDLPTEVISFTLPRGYTELRGLARRRGVSFSAWMAARIVLACAAYGRQRGEADRARGILIAASRPAGAGAFRAMQLPLELSVDQLASAARSEAEAGRTLQRPRGHDDVLLALFYASRRLLGPRRCGPFRARSVHFTYSDLSRWNLERSMPRGLGIEHAEVLVTPSHPEHAGLTLTRVGDRLHLALLGCAGVVQLPSFRDHLLSTLEIR